MHLIQNQIIYSLNYLFVSENNKKELSSMINPHAPSGLKNSYSGLIEAVTQAKLDIFDNPI